MFQHKSGIVNKKNKSKKSIHYSNLLKIENKIIKIITIYGYKKYYFYNIYKDKYELLSIIEKISRIFIVFHHSFKKKQNNYIFRKLLKKYKINNSNNDTKILKNKKRINVNKFYRDLIFKYIIIILNYKINKYLKIKLKKNIKLIYKLIKIRNKVYNLYKEL